MNIRRLPLILLAPLATLHAADELTVAERKSDDTWGMTSRKKLPTATITAQPPVTHP